MNGLVGAIVTFFPYVDKLQFFFYINLLKLNDSNYFDKKIVIVIRITKKYTYLKLTGQIEMIH